jgi:hypothetical protein
LNFVQIVLLLLTLNKHLTSKLQFSPHFTLDSIADSDYRGKCDVDGFLIFEWTFGVNTLLEVASKMWLRKDFFCPHTRGVFMAFVGIKTDLRFKIMQ